MPVSIPTELVDLEAYQAKLDKINAEFDAKIGLIEGQIASLDAEIASVEGQISYWGGKVDEAQGKVNTLTGQIKDLENQISTWRDRKNKAHTLGYKIQTQPYKNSTYVRPSYDDCMAVWAGYLTDYSRGSYGPNIYVRVCFKIDSTWTCMYRDENTYALENVANNEISSLENELSVKRSDLFSAQSELFNAKSQLSYAQNTLEADTRHMHDLQLAKEAAEYERTDAIHLWQAEYEAAQERKRIELDSIARDIQLGYPLMDAETARTIAESAYADALARGFTRVSDAMAIATQIADDWYNTHIFPHFTTKIINCPSCGAKLEMTVSDIAEHNRELYCPYCGAYCC